MKTEQHNQEDSDFPVEIGNPARQALRAAGYRQLDQLAGVGESDILRLHGVGPKAIDRLRKALAARGLSFAGPKR